MHENGHVETVLATFQENLEFFWAQTPNDFCDWIAWENSRHFATPPLVSRRNEVWETSAGIPYWWRVTTQIWLVLLIGRAAWGTCFNQLEELLRSGKWHVISTGFSSTLVSQLSLRGELVVASQNVGIFLRLIYSRLRWNRQWTPKIQQQMHDSFEMVSQPKLRKGKQNSCQIHYPIKKPPN